MRLRVILLALIGALSIPVISVTGDEELARLVDRAQSAPVDQQVRLDTEIAERQLKLADQLYSADKVEDARAAVTAVASYAAKATDAAIQSGKHLKDTEIAMRKMAAKLRDMMRKVSLEDQAPLKNAADHLETLRTSLLTHMFKGKK
jgi:hypothetical protein